MTFHVTPGHLQQKKNNYNLLQSEQPTLAMADPRPSAANGGKPSIREAGRA